MLYKGCMEAFVVLKERPLSELAINLRGADRSHGGLLESTTTRVRNKTDTAHPHTSTTVFGNKFLFFPISICAYNRQAQCTLPKPVTSESTGHGLQASQRDCALPVPIAFHWSAMTGGGLNTLRTDSIQTRWQLLHQPTLLHLTTALNPHQSALSYHVST